MFPVPLDVAIIASWLLFPCDYQNIALVSGMGNANPSNTRSTESSVDVDNLCEANRVGEGKERRRSLLHLEPTVKEKLLSQRLDVASWLMT